MQDHLDRCNVMTKDFEIMRHVYVVIQFWIAKDDRFRGRNLNKGDRIVRPVSRVLGPHPRCNGLRALRGWLVNKCRDVVKPDSHSIS